MVAINAHLISCEREGLLWYGYRYPRGREHAGPAGINDDGGEDLIESHLDSEDQSGDGDIAFVTCGGADLID